MVKHNITHTILLICFIYIIYIYFLSFRKLMTCCVSLSSSLFSWKKFSGCFICGCVISTAYYTSVLWLSGFRLLCAFSCLVNLTQPWSLPYCFAYQYCFGCSWYLCLHIFEKTGLKLLSLQFSTWILLKNHKEKRKSKTKKEISNNKRGLALSLAVS